MLCYDTSALLANLTCDFLNHIVKMETLQSPPDPTPTNALWNYFMNPWVLALLAAAIYYTYQNYMPSVRWPQSNSTEVSPMDEEKVRKMMEARNKQQAKYDDAAKELEEKRKEEPPAKLGPISKQIAAKAKLRPGILSNVFQRVLILVSFSQIRLQSTYGRIWLIRNVCT